MRSTFWPNRIFERQSSQNRETGLKFSSKRENSALSWKLYKTLFSGHAQHVLAKSHFGASKFSKSSHWPQILWKRENSALSMVYKTLFSGHANTFCPNRILERQSSKSSKLYKMKIVHTLFRSSNCFKTGKHAIFERQSSQNRHTGLKLSSKRKNSAFENCTKRSFHAQHVLAKIAFLSVKVLKIVKLASNSLQNGKTVRFPWKLYKTLFSGHAQHVLAKIAFASVKVLKIVTVTSNSR